MFLKKVKLYLKFRIWSEGVAGSEKISRLSLKVFADHKPFCPSTGPQNTIFYGHTIELYDYSLWKVDKIFDRWTVLHCSFNGQMGPWTWLWIGKSRASKMGTKCQQNRVWHWILHGLNDDAIKNPRSLMQKWKNLWLTPLVFSSLFRCPVKYGKTWTPQLLKRQYVLCGRRPC